MKPSLAHKLFVAVLTTAVLVVLAMLAATHLSFTRGFLGYLNEQGVLRMEIVLPQVRAAYIEHGSWEFLRNNREAWFSLLRPPRQQQTDSESDHEGGSRRLPMVSDLTGAMLRIGLLDLQGERLAGLPLFTKEAMRLPVEIDGRTVAWLAMEPFQSVSTAGGDRFRDGQLQAGLLMGALALLLAAAIAWWFTRVLLAPVRRVARATHRLAAGDYATRVEVRSDDEVGQLATDFNQLALALGRNEQMRRDFMADVSHELRTPLGVLHGELEAIEDGVRELTPATLASLQSEVATLNKLVGDLYELSLSDVGALSYRKTELDAGALLQLTVDGFRERLASRQLGLELQLPPQPLWVFGDERRLQQLFNNLCENSLRYTDAGGLLRIQARQAGAQVLIDFMDSGPGVPDAQLERLFERFYRVEHSRNRAHGGAGLGLAICRNIVQAHDGTIAALASPLGGLRVAIALPSL